MAVKLLGAAIVPLGLFGVLSAGKGEGDWKAVRNDIAGLLEKEDYDDGSHGPLLVRLAWHASGTYSQFTKDGGSNGATMRFHPELNDGANAGLNIAMNVLEPVKKKHPWASYADIWTLAGSVAIEEMGGPKIEWRPGRTDSDGSQDDIPPNGRLPDALREGDHLRAIFYRMGFSDREIVALSGAHALGRCHTDRSGFTGPWTRAPTAFSNEYFRELVENTWTEKKWSGPKQFEDPTGDLMMLVSDLALLKDDDFKKWVMHYKENEDEFFQDFKAAWEKLIELGVER
mmetsp:Transcript_21015/g.59131  ORF Transcript_21015/g.59131 Transcript_21015/m.59131 type:complete len:286 (-) Transcript_21015:898-1755(-)|eukprot:CAMPEP_0119119460 /NCGR_PEP_ID=MMETSP1310-20130426/945_1 /TAXON_ID=464262 /ORGANISM="Genus nov. species nov., Strain RCC2339" /LENGTH=285 /DNA_ID=CAMNT_0007108899 /DNA_START=157 /DNA_END=1014 /DNA_ORIENTATION=+